MRVFGIVISGFMILSAIVSLFQGNIDRTLLYVIMTFLVMDHIDSDGPHYKI